MTNNEMKIQQGIEREPGVGKGGRREGGGKWRKEKGWGEGRGKE